MSTDRVDLVRVTYETWNEHGPAAIRPLLADEVELHDAPELPDAQVWRGPDAVIDRLRAVRDAVGGGSVQLQGFDPSGDGVLVSMLWRLDSDGGDALLGPIFHLVEVVGERISRIRVFLSEADARRA